MIECGSVNCGCAHTHRARWSFQLYPAYQTLTGQICAVVGDDGRQLICSNCFI